MFGQVNSRFSTFLTGYLIKNSSVREKDRAIYQYGIEIGLSIVGTFCSILAMALIFKNMKETLLFFVSFIALRRYSGGYHASTPFRCYLMSIGLYGIFCLICKTRMLSWDYLSLVSMLFSIMVVWKCAPIIHKNRRVCESDSIRYQRLSRYVCLIECGVVMLGSVFLENVLYMNALSLGALAVCVSLLWAKMHINNHEKS